MKTLLILLIVTSISDIEEGKKNLSNISEELKRTTEVLKKAEEKKGNLGRQIETSLQKEKRDEKKVAEASKHLKKTGKNLKKTEEKITLVSEELVQEKDNLSILVKKAYFSKPPDNISYLLLSERDKRPNLFLLIDRNVGKIEDKEAEKKEAGVEKKALEYLYDHEKKSKEDASLNIKMEREKRTVIAKNLDKTEKEAENWKKKITTLKEEQKRLEALIAELSAKRRVKKEGEAYKLKGGLVWPISGGRITREFGRYTHPETGAVMINKGVDIAAPLGTEVRSIGSGEVVYADWFVGYGKLIMIDHGSGLYSLYAYLNKISVKQGETITGNSAIGAVGSTGSVETPTLHFEIRVNGQPQDPLDWVR